MSSNDPQSVTDGVRLPPGSWWDWEVVTCDPARLVLGAGHDLTYRHDLELVFQDPTFIACPTSFQDPVFRPATPEESATVTANLGDPPPVLVAFEADAGGPTPTTCLIAAETVHVVTGPVPRRPAP